MIFLAGPGRSGDSCGRYARDDSRFFCFRRRLQGFEPVGGGVGGHLGNLHGGQPGEQVGGSLPGCGRGGSAGGISRLELSRNSPSMDGVSPLVFELSD